MKKYLPFSFLLLLTCLNRIVAQDTLGLQYRNAQDLTLAGKIMPTGNPFHRVDQQLVEGLPKSTRELFKHGAGMAIAFTTNSTVIAAKWCVSTEKPANNMTPIADKGLDLYIRKNGKWVFAGVGRPGGECSQYVIVKNMVKGDKECLLYLPTYDETRSLELGVEKNATIAPLADPFQKRVLIYGSSILQGASACRPGMAYPARLSRNTGINFLNLGLSGSAKMEKEAADLVTSIMADAYVLDCVPNTAPELITERTAYLVNTIRNKHPKAPIIVIQSIFREQGNFDEEVRKRVEDQNAAITEEVNRLRKQGMKDLYFITAENMMGSDHEGSVDGIHPNDLGFDRMIKVLEPKLSGILSKYGISAQQKKARHD